MGSTESIEPTTTAHIDAVMKRISATDEATTQNRQHRLLIKALDASGLAHRAIVRNVDPSATTRAFAATASPGARRGASGRR